MSVFSCTVLFVSISQVIGCEDRPLNDLYCVEWGVKLYSNQPAVRLKAFAESRHCNRQSRSSGAAVIEKPAAASAILIKLPNGQT